MGWPSYCHSHSHDPVKGSGINIPKALSSVGLEALIPKESTVSLQEKKQNGSSFSLQATAPPGTSRQEESPS